MNQFNLDLIWKQQGTKKAESQSCNWKCHAWIWMLNHIFAYLISMLCNVKRSKLCFLFGFSLFSNNIMNKEIEWIYDCLSFCYCIDLAMLCYMLFLFFFIFWYQKRGKAMSWSFSHQVLPTFYLVEPRHFLSFYKRDRNLKKLHTVS